MSLTNHWLVHEFITQNAQVAHCFAKSRGDPETGVTGEALKGFEACMHERNQGEPCTPEKLTDADYDADDFFVRETTVIISG